jgi:multicomponent Na+:H+ antiporter subunit E
MNRPDSLDAAPPPTTAAQPRFARWRWAAGIFWPLLGVWLALNGSTGWLAGIGAAALAALAGAWLVPGAAHPWRPLQLVPFVAFFLGQSLRGGIDVARRALHPRMQVSPGWIEHPIWLPPGQPRTLMIGVVSLLPGSLSAELDPDSQVLHVHTLAGEVDPGLEALQVRIGEIFGLRAPTAP